MIKNIHPFREFWLDCYSTILFTIYCALYKDRTRIYNNNYSYSIVTAGRSCVHKFKTICLEISMNSFQNSFLKKYDEFSLKSKRNLKHVNEILEKNNLILLLGVDLYYWIDDGIHWKRNHIQHFSLVKEYDADKNEYVVLETGARGYKEYRISEKNFLKAAKMADVNSIVYQTIEGSINLLDNKTIFGNNIDMIIQSIDCVIGEFDSIWTVTDYSFKDMLYFMEFVQTHLYAIENRQKANSLLMKSLFEQNKNQLCYRAACEFTELSDRYYSLKAQLMTDAKSGKLNESIDRYRKYLLDYLKIEKEIWKKISENFKED